MKHLLLIGVATALTACSADDSSSWADAGSSSTSTSTSTTTGGEGATTGETGDTGDTGTTGDTGGTAGETTATGGDPECSGDAPECADGCGSDWLHGPADCVQGQWACEVGVIMDDCPDDTCWGAPLPGEACDGGQWICAPQDFVYEACSNFICATCSGFDAPVKQSGCTCACNDGSVYCEVAAEPEECLSTGATTLDGVSITIDDSACVFTLAQATAGISIPYTISIDAEAAAAQPVVPWTQDAGSCGQPEDNRLIVFERLQGSDLQYCLCDTGLCAGVGDQPVTLVAGVTSHSFDWDGVEWYGPSDTGNPKGDPFPAGTYTLTVSAKGDKPDLGPFEVLATLTITLVP